MKKEITPNKIMITALIIFITVMAFAFVETQYYDNAQKDACIDFSGKKLNADNKNYCIDEDGLAQEVVFDCTGVLFTSKCTVIKVKQ